MMRANVGVRGLVLLTCLLGSTTTVLAQSSIAGVVKDISGAVLPGVFVEASSPALIEGAKSATTDGAGLFRIIGLRPGIYSITFTLAGFATIKRADVELPAEFTYTANAEMKLSALEETLTVSGAAPMVDLQSAARVQTLSKEVMDNVPTSRTIQTMGQLIVGVTVATGSPDVGGSNATEQSYMSVRGIPAAQNTVMINGLAVNGLESNGAIQNYFNDAASEQIVYQTSDTTAANSGGGVQVNMIPRSGGNRFSGDSQLAYRPGALVPDNLDRHRPTGIANPPGSKFISDLTISQGGPIKRNKLWFFATARDNRVTNYVLDTFFDDGARGYDDNYVRDILGRVTWQVNPTGKFQAYIDKIWKYKGHEMGALTDPETAAGRRSTPNYSTGSLQYTWAASSRFLVDVGYSFNNETRTTVSTGGLFDRSMDDPSDQLLANYQSNDWYSHVRRAAAGASAVSATLSISDQFPIRDNYQASATYVTGSHNIKAGFGWETGEFYHRNEVHGDIYNQSYESFVQDPVTHNYSFVSQPCAAALLAAFPNCRGALNVSIANTPTVSQETMRANTGLYVQDQWKFRQLSLNAGLRWEWLNSQVDATDSPAGRFVPARSQPKVTDRPDWTDWAPRFSMVWDVLGKGRTALKYSVNRYNTAETTTVASGYNLLSLTASTRQWTDLNGDNIPQGQRTWSADGKTFTDCTYQTAGCELYLSGSSGLNPVNGAAQTLTPLASTFGVPGSLPVYSGFPRLYRIEHSVEVQHQLTKRIGTTFGWTHWDRYNNQKTINQFRQAYDIDYTTVQFYNPIDGSPLPFLYYNITAEASVRQSAPGANTTIVDPTNKMFYDAFQMELRTRPWAGAYLAGGFTLEKTRSTNCETSVPGAVVDPNSIRYCDQTDLLGDGSGVTTPYLQAFKVNFSFPVPYGFVLSAVYQNLDQGSFNRTFNYGRVTQRYPDGTAAFKDASGNIAPAVGCPAGQAVCPVPGAITGPPTLTSAGDINLPIDTPGLERDERLNQFDIKLSKNFKWKGYTMGPTFEVFNLFNADTILGRSSLAYMNTGGTYLRPSNILKPRLYGFGYMIKW